MVGYFLGAAFFLIGAAALHYGVRSEVVGQATRGQYRLFRRLLRPTTEEGYVRRAVRIFDVVAVAFSLGGVACLVAGFATL